LHCLAHTAGQQDRSAPHRWTLPAIPARAGRADARDEGPSPAVRRLAVSALFVCDKVALVIQIE